MHSFAAILAPFALLLPAAAANAPLSPDPAQADHAALAPDETSQQAPSGFKPMQRNPWMIFLDSHRPGKQGQVRIQQRVVIRISPRPIEGRQDLLAEFPRGEVTTRLKERKMGKCVPIQGIAGVQTGEDNRLILFMRDRRIVSAALEKACNARDFYSGFLVERNDDGLLCVKRDKLQSRAGAKCEVQQLRQLIEVKD